MRGWRALRASLALVACAALAALLLWALPGLLRREFVEIREYGTRPTERADFLAPYVGRRGVWPATADDVQFAEVVVRVVPEDAIVGVRGSTETSWVRALAFAAAPRLFVPDERHAWVVGRARASTEPPNGRRWYRGDYWLVRR